MGSTPAGSLCRLSLRESTPFRGAKGDLTSTPAHVTRETRNLNHADFSPRARMTHWNSTTLREKLINQDQGEVGRPFTGRDVPLSRSKADHETVPVVREQ